MSRERGGPPRSGERHGGRRAPLLAAIYAYVVATVLLAVVCYPLTQGTAYDSFPGSSYPMFGRERPREVTIHHIVALRDDGRRRPVPPPLVGSDEVLQAAATIHSAIRRRRAPALCREVADRVAADRAWDDYAWLEVASDRFDLVTYFRGEPRPIAREPHARCRIPRDG